MDLFFILFIQLQLFFNVILVEIFDQELFFNLAKEVFLDVVLVPLSNELILTDHFEDFGRFFKAELNRVLDLEVGRLVNV